MSSIIQPNDPLMQQAMIAEQQAQLRQQAIQQLAEQVAEARRAPPGDLVVTVGEHVAGIRRGDGVENGRVRACGVVAREGSRGCRRQCHGW